MVDVRAAAVAAVIVLAAGCSAPEGGSTNESRSGQEQEEAGPVAVNGQTSVEMLVNRSYTGEGEPRLWRIHYEVEATLEPPVAGVVAECGISPASGTGAALLELQLVNTSDPDLRGEDEVNPLRPRFTADPVRSGPVVWVDPHSDSCTETPSNRLWGDWEYRDTVSVRGYLLDVPLDGTDSGLTLEFEHGAQEYVEGEPVTVPLLY